ncbi:MAG: TonB-dependent receptor plug domain-containing protein [Povalibacter sp.]|jgi:iron complex outermembrane receptor protein
METQIAARHHRGLMMGLCLISTTCVLAEEPKPAEEVIVTGSRIARESDFENPSPVITIGRDSIEKSGYNNLQQIMEKLPANGNGAFSTRGNNQDSTANGAASISLRGLGADATLVLVNGRRVAINSFAENVTTNFVDINSIPVAAIDRVEVLKDGSSAVYGSDAVAGVVNVILRRNFEGFEVSGSYGSVDEGSYDERNVSAVWGIGKDDANVTFIFDYFKNSTLSNSERWYFGTANQTERGGQDFRSSRGYPGRFIVNGATRIDPACPAGSVAGQTCVYDFGPWNLLIPSAERTGLMMLAHQDLAEGLEVFAEVGVQHNISSAQGAPTPLDETAGLTVPITNPGNPYPDATSIDVGRYRTVDAGPRQWDIQSDNLRGVLGLRGGFAAWTWELSAQRARGESDQTGDRSQGWVRTDFLQTEITAGRYNPFGGVQNPQPTIDAITTNLVRRGQSDLTMYEAETSGDLFDIPGGTVKMAAGAEYRKEAISDIPDDQFQRGLIFGTEAVSAAASRNSWAAFVEFSVPLLQSLELSLAARYDDYSDFGSTTNPKIALRWSPIEQLAFRASWGTGFRAPSLAQIGLGPSQSSQFFTDTFGCADNPTYCAPTDYNLVFSGNPDLKAEESESFNVGIAWQPSSTTNVTLDYWDIKQEKKIDQVPFGFLYSESCNVQSSTVCTRGAPLAGDALGPLQTINTTFININEQSTSGLDLSVAYSVPLAASTLSLGLNYTHLLDFDRVELGPDGTTFVTRSLAGEYEYPEDRALVWADFGSQNWGIYTSVNYTGPFQDMPDADFDGTLDYDTVDTRDVGQFTTVNLQLRYTGIQGLQLLVGLDNAFNEKPPFAVGNGDDDLYGYVQSQHNPRGRFWNAKAIYRF